jgi:hypothetical protein
MKKSSCTITGNRIEWNARGGLVLKSGNHYNIMGNQGDGSRQSRGRIPGTLVRGAEDYGGLTEVGQSFRTEHPENDTKRRSAGLQDT